MIDISLPHKNIIKSLDSISSNSNKRNTSSYLINSSDSLNNSTSNKGQKNEFDLIIKLMLSETETNITRFDLYLSFYIRKNIKTLNDLLEKIVTILNANSANIYYLAVIKCIDTILGLLIENFQIINLLNNTIPLILTILFQEENIKNIEAIGEINSFLGKLIKIGGTNLSGLIQEIVDTIFLDIFKENPNDCNIYYAYVSLLCEIMKNSPVAGFNSMLVKNGIENFTKLFGICFKNKNLIIRQISGELTCNYIKMLLNRDSETKKSYISLLYLKVFEKYEFNVKLNNIFPNNYFLVSGFFVFLKNIYLSYPIFFNDKTLYCNLIDNIIKCKNCGKNESNIKIDFIKFIPDLYKMNKTIFKKNYLKNLLEYSNEVLKKESNLEIKYSLLLVLATLNFYEYDLINQICRETIIPLLQKFLSEKNSPDDRVLKCLADLLNNKKGIISQFIIQMMDVFNILSKIFKTPLNDYKNEFLIALINYYNYCSMENITVITMCLNTISLIICREEFKLDSFLKFNENINGNLINPKLHSLKANLIKDLNKFLNEHKYQDKKNKDHQELVLNALNLFSNIKHNLFYRDMFFFYNYKLLPLLKVYQNRIRTKIVSIMLCDFVKIYNNEENISEFFIKNIIDSILNLFIFNKAMIMEDKIINIFENKNIFIDVLLKDKNLFFRKIFEILKSALTNQTKELLIRIIRILEKNDNDKGIYIGFISNYISSLIFEIYNSKNSIFEEYSISFLLNLTKYFKHLYPYDIIEKVINVSLFILTRYEYKDIIVINALKIDSELLNEDFEIKYNNTNKCYIICQILYIISLKLLKDCNTNDYLSQNVLKLLYLIIKKKNIDIYTQNKIDRENLILSSKNIFNCYDVQINEIIDKLLSFNKIAKNINVIELLFNHLIKGEKYENSVLIMKILGICGAISPTELEKLYLMNTENYSEEKPEEFILEGEELRITRYDKVKRKRMNLNFPYIEPSNTKAVLSLMEILKYYTQKDLKIKIILNLQLLIQSISSNQSYFIDIILPTIIQILPLYEYKYQIVLLQNISLIMSNFKEKSRPYLDEIVNLINDYDESNYLEVIYQLYTILFENYEFEMGKYYDKLIPKFIKTMKSEEKENISYAKLLLLASRTGFIYPYIKIIVLETKIVLLKINDLKFIIVLFDLLKQIISTHDTYIYFPIILLSLNQKIKAAFGFNIYNYKGQNTHYQNKLKNLSTRNNSNLDLNISILNKFLEILKIMNDRYRKYFMSYLPKIINELSSCGLLDYSNCKQKLKKIICTGNNYIFMNANGYIKKMSICFCKINCHLGFNSITNSKIEKKIEIKTISSKDFEEYYKSIIDMDVTSENYSRSKKPRGSFAKKKLNNIIVKNRRGLVNNELLIKTFDNSNCKLEKDWNEWFKLTNKSLFEQNPSNFLYIFYLITQYYFSLNLDLTKHAFYSVYINNSDVNKEKLNSFLIKAVKNNKTPDSILLATLDLFEFMERKNINLPDMNYTLFGDIAYKCKAFAKALFYKEKDFEDNINIEEVDNLIDLYFKLNIQENGEGLINQIEKNHKYRYIKDYDKKYIWYINLHDYSKALNIINSKLLKEKETDKINELKKYKNICLNGLCDWEQILSEDESPEIQIDSEGSDNMNEINTYSNINKKRMNEDEDSTENILTKKLLLSKCCVYLGKWDKLSEYIGEINLIFLDNGGKEFLNYNKEKENKNYNNNNYLSHEQEKIANIILNEINKDNNNNIKEEINYIPYNDIINNNNKFEFLKVDDSLFDLMMFSSLINARKNNFEVARKYIEDCGKILINNLKFLIKESYSRGYDILMNNQLLRQLELYVDYKQYHSNDRIYFEKMKLKINNNNKKISNIPELLLKFITLDSLIFPLEEEYPKYIKLANIYRKSGKFEQSEIILSRLKEKLNLKLDETTNNSNILLDEKRIKIELSYNKCLYDKGNINEAVENGKCLIDLLNDEDLNPYNNLSDNIKGKIFGNYAIYRINQLISNNNNLKISRQKSEGVKRAFFRHTTNYLSEHSFFSSFFKKSNSHKIKQEKFNKNDIEAKASKKLIIHSEKKVLNNKDVLQYRFIKNRNEVNIINQYLSLATQYNPNSYKYWNNYALFNYKCYKFILSEYKNKSDTLKEENESKIINHAFNALNGFKNCFQISNKNKVKTLQDCLSFIDIFFELGNKNKDLLCLIESVINESNVENFVGVTPQLFCRFDINDVKVLEVLVKLLIKLFINYPQLLIFPLIIIKNSKRRKDKSIANLILQNSFKSNEEFKKLYIEYEEFVNELNKCSVLFHEDWLETIENSAKSLVNKDYIGMINQLIKMHNKMNKQMVNLYEINFYQRYGTELKEAEKYINKLIEEQNLNYLNNAWEIYQSIYERIGENYSKFQSISLQYISTKLYNFQDSNIIMPGSFNSYYYNLYEKEFNKDIVNKKLSNLNIKMHFKPITIQRIEKYLEVVNSKQHPRKTCMIGSDSKEYLFLLKGHEDLRQDERVIQIFNLVNLILSKEKIYSNKNLFITVYSVIPLSHKSGLIGWVHNCDTLNRLIKEQRAMSNIIQNIEHNSLNKFNPKYETSKFINKVETFLEVLKDTKGEELQKIIWIKSKNCESWVLKTTNYSRSLAIMSIIGYILGLGDRHLNNLLMSRKNGQIIHIDFGDCFEVAMKRDKYPEKVPFRLTRMLVKALGLTEIEGNFRITCEKIMNLLRKNKDSMIAILSALIHNPLISFRLMIPLIIKKQKNKKIQKNHENDNKSNSVIDEYAFMNKNNSPENNDFSFNVKKLISKNIKISASSENLHGNANEHNKNDETGNNNMKDERQMMENEKRQIFNLYEENDEFDSEELYKIAQIVLNRIKDKLNGMDIYPNNQLDEKEQVDKLIKQARSIENLSQSYLGWCPFW